MYGTQATGNCGASSATFENDVKMYGTQAGSGQMRMSLQFENDVKMYGTQANNKPVFYMLGLRMM